MKLSIATTITLLVALATATLRGLGGTLGSLTILHSYLLLLTLTNGFEGECRKANDCCPCDTGSKRSLGCVRM